MVQLVLMGFPPNARDQPSRLGVGAWGLLLLTPTHGSWPWLFKARGHAPDLGLLLLHRHVLFLDPPHLWCELHLPRS